MPKATLTDIFPGATQTATTITIPKSALTSSGLAPLAENTGGQLLSAMAKKASEYMTQTRFDSDSEQTIVVEVGTDQTTFRGTDRVVQTPITINCYKAAPATVLDPDDY